MIMYCDKCIKETRKGFSNMRSVIKAALKIHVIADKPVKVCDGCGETKPCQPCSVVTY